MQSKLFCFVLLVSLFVIRSPAQLLSAPEPQSATITGAVSDVDGGLIPGATVTASTPTASQPQTATSDSAGTFVLKSLLPAVPYHLTIKANGFADATSDEITLTPGQQFEAPTFKLIVAAVETTVSAETPVQIATEQVHAEEKQRILGVIPNFYVVYDKQFVPLTAKLKFQLALRASTDVVTAGGTIFIAAIDQAADTPGYQQGWKGYGQRVGAVYANGFSDILIGGAILPSILHQDPRYFYQGTGSNKSRALHALEAPFVARGDNGKWQPNFSSVGGDFASAALSTLYYPPGDRGSETVLTNAAITTVGRIANAMAQEFLFSKFTSRGKKTP